MKNKNKLSEKIDYFYTCIKTGLDVDISWIYIIDLTMKLKSRIMSVEDFKKEVEKIWYH
jgi:hypothetical protein